MAYIGWWSQLVLFWWTKNVVEAACGRWAVAILWWELFLVVAAPSCSPFLMEGSRRVAKEKKKGGVYPSLHSGASESSPLCVLGWAHVRQGTVELLFLWGKQWHPVAITYGENIWCFWKRRDMEGWGRKGGQTYPLSHLLQISWWMGQGQCSPE